MYTAVLFHPRGTFRTQPSSPPPHTPPPPRLFRGPLPPADLHGPTRTMNVLNVDVILHRQREEGRRRRWQQPQEQNGTDAHGPELLQNGAQHVDGVHRARVRV